MRRNLWGILALVIITGIAGIVLYTLPMNLGLDLQGGIHVVLQAQETDGVPITSETIDRAIAVIERRVNGLGVAEPLVQRQGTNRIIVELPGIENPEQAVDLIGKTAQLEFKDPLGNTLLTGADLSGAELGRDNFNRPAVNLSFTEEGARKFARATTQFLGQQIAITLDQEVISAPVVQTPITDGRAQITGVSLEEAKDLVVLLQAGALPVPLEQMEIRHVGPSLGKEAIDQSLKAGLIGIVLVILFMLAYYRLSGGIADVALGIYVLLVLAAMVAMRATLTLPGIAGFILSIGMAVDANVIIFERIKEELRAGKSMRAAIRAGFDRALRAVVDANVTTLLTAAVLFYLGTGPVRGFAVTLSLGILASMFTAIVVTRYLLELLVGRAAERARLYFGVKGLAVE